MTYRSPRANIILPLIIRPNPIVIFDRFILLSFTQRIAVALHGAQALQRLFLMLFIVPRADELYLWWLKRLLLHFIQLLLRLDIQTLILLALLSGPVQLLVYLCEPINKQKLLLYEVALDTFECTLDMFESPPYLLAVYTLLSWLLLDEVAVWLWEFRWAVDESALELTLHGLVWRLHGQVGVGLLSNMVQIDTLRSVNKFLALRWLALGCERLTWLLVTVWQRRDSLKFLISLIFNSFYILGPNNGICKFPFLFSTKNIIFQLLFSLISFTFIHCQTSKGIYIYGLSFIEHF